MDWVGIGMDGMDLRVGGGIVEHLTVLIINAGADRKIYIFDFPKLQQILSSLNSSFSYQVWPQEKQVE